MAIYRTDKNQVYRNGKLIAEEIVQVDITKETIHRDLHSKAHAALHLNAAYLALPNPTPAQTATQIKRLTRECSALIRLLLAANGDEDVLVENTDT